MSVIAHEPQRCADRGSTSLSIVLLTPLFIVLLFAAFQAALWGHARTEARVAASDAAAQIARFGSDPSAAEASVRSSLDGSTLRDVGVSFAGSDGLVVVVTVTAEAPGIIVGTSRSIDVTSAVPRERIVE